MPLYTLKGWKKHNNRIVYKRIVSVVPSQTELLHHLGLEDEVIGITKFCVHPNHWYRKKTRIGGTKNLRTEHIRQLKPDMVLANKEENVKAQIEELASFTDVWLSDVKTLEDALEMIACVGELTHRQAAAKKLSSDILDGFDNLAHSTDISCAYLIWQNPLMTVGGDTFIHDLLKRAGFQNVFGTELRYPTITESELIEANPVVLLLSSEPFPFSDKHLQHFRNLLPNAKVVLADGELFSWYGSRLLHSATYFQRLKIQVSGKRQ